MHIKRLEIQGFKTFADRTELELTDGITSIVGPNGSGKSNIADAVSWVLGEQNVRNLRGSRSQDVIFAGSDTRKPLGMAEVSITIDNSCGSLPLDFSEVTVTRRVYRSGESDYLINKSSCRLKDIYELFLDTGMGREAYSMVSQGEIDAILSVKSEDRRSLIEEAAGIKKYRFRRKEAAKKLENTEGNLRRVNDIVSELSGQVEPLAEQAEEAARYQELVSRLSEIETGLLINDLRRWTDELDHIRQAKTEGTKRAAEQDERISDLEWEKEKLSAQLSELDREVDAARAKHQEFSAAAQQIKSKLALIEERKKSADDAGRRLDSEIEQLNQKIEEAKERLTRLRDESAACVESETRLVTDVSEHTKSLESITSELESASRIVEDHKSAYVELARAQAAKRTELENLRARQSELQAALAKYESELKSLKESGQQAVYKQNEFQAKAEELRKLQKNREEELPPLRTRRENAKSQIAAISDKLGEVNRQTVSKSARLSTLKEMAEAHEGFFEGVRSVMAAGRNRKLSGNYAVVADVITVPQGFETAIEVALGSAVQDIITDTVDDAKRAIKFLKENRAGRATFLPLNGIRPQMSSNTGDLKEQGVKGLASDLISFDKKYAPAINVLLGRVVIVDNIDNAVKFSRGKAAWGRIVTLDGEVIVPTGAMTGGIRPGKGSGLLGRKQEMDALTAELSSLDTTRVEYEKESESAKEALSATRARIEELERAAASDRLSLAEADRQIEFTLQERHRIERQVEVVALEKEEIEAALQSDSSALLTLEEDLFIAGKENLDLDEFVSGAQKRVEELTAKRGTISSELMEMSVELASVRERQTGFKQSVRQTEASLSEMEQEIETRRSEVARKQAESDVNDVEHDKLVAESVEREAALGTYQAQLEALLARRSDAAQTASVADSELKALNHARSETVEMLRDCDVREARLEVQITQTSERLLQEYEISAEEALAREEPEYVERGTITEVARLRREIKSMGAVNTGAIQEYERIRERWEFLTMQRNDLEAAREKLQDAIQEIDAGTRELFMDTFHSVEQHFDFMFKRLFGGGHTQLVLTDPSNLLETGVEVIVQPPGKKLQNLQLLSGGERALTASALLFALLLVRPSPFVFFDEVDAPLDDTNVERFADVLREFATNSQFIVITHNRGTMEASDTLYGVTMQDPGVSKLISVRLADEAERDKIGREFVYAEPVGAK